MTAAPNKVQVNNRQDKKRSRVPLTLFLILVLAVGAWFGMRYWHQYQADKKAADMVEVLRQYVPNIGSDAESSGRDGRDPLAAMSIQEIDIVGCLEIPSLDLIAPVAGKNYYLSGFATWQDGSPVKGRFRLFGNRTDVFRHISRAKPGDHVFFTDVDGVRYAYEVTTQFHLKDWDEADQDMMLCYETDGQTSFVLGCSRIV